MERMESLMYKNTRSMMNPGWREDKWYQGGKQLYANTTTNNGNMAKETKITTMLTKTIEKDNTPKALSRNDEAKSRNY